MRVCSRCGCRFSDHRKNCFFCGALSELSTDSGSYESEYSNRRGSFGWSGGFSALKTLSILIILIALFAPMVGRKGFGNHSFWYTITKSSVDLFESRVTWMALAAIVPAILIWIGANNHSKGTCYIASIFANFFLFIAFGDLINSYIDNFGSNFGLEYMLGENSPIRFGFWASWVGHVLCLLFGIIAKE